jgi:hypothetical protein
MAPLPALAKPSLIPLGGPGALNDMPTGEFSIEKCDSALMTRPNPVRRGKSPARPSRRAGRGSLTRCAEARVALYPTQR